MFALLGLLKNIR